MGSITTPSGWCRCEQQLSCRHAADPEHQRGDRRASAPTAEQASPLRGQRKQPPRHLADQQRCANETGKLHRKHRIGQRLGRIA